MSRARPILFSGPMVRALLEGKTQTRRIVKPQPPHRTNFVRFNDGRAFFCDGNHPKHHACEEYEYGVKCPYGVPGDLLWVRETWGVGTRPDPNEGWRDGIEYRADDFELSENELLPLHKANVPDGIDLDDYRGRWRPSIHMPRWASRLTLELTDVRIERVQEISDADAMAEGFEHEYADNGDVKRPASFKFLDLFYDINKRAPRDENSWVWVLTFKVHEMNIDDYLRRQNDQPREN